MASLLSSIEEKQTVAAEGAAGGRKAQQSALQQKFSAAEESATSNLTDDTVGKLEKASHRLQAVDAEERRAVKQAVSGASDAAINPRAEAASKAAIAAYVTIDPLYGMGDDAENTADALNDRANDAKWCAKQALHKLDKDIRHQGHHIAEKQTAPLMRAMQQARVEVHTLQQELKAAEAPPASQLMAQTTGLQVRTISATFLLAGAVGSATTLATMRIIAAWARRTRDLGHPLLAA
jgi:hypothetical protein